MYLQQKKSFMFLQKMNKILLRSLRYPFLEIEQNQRNLSLSYLPPAYDADYNIGTSILVIIYVL